MSKTQVMIEAVNANIKKLTSMRYAVERIEDLTAQRAEVVYSHPAKKDGWEHHVVFTRRQAHYGDAWIMEMDHDSYQERQAKQTDEERDEWLADQPTDEELWSQC